MNHAKRSLCMLITLALLAALFVGCDQTGDTQGESSEEAARYQINGVPISEYTIIYSDTAPDYTERAAVYLRDEIKKRTGIRLRVKSDKDKKEPTAHEIVVGETNRPISAVLDAETAGLEFAILADDAHVAMEGDYFVIAAAAYFFIQTYMQAEPYVATVAKETMIYEPITKEAKNCIFLIGDGMGFNQTKLFEVYSAKELGLYSDGEDAFYGYMLPYIGAARTSSLSSGATDSAAAGTALATGYKTKNGRIGRDGNGNDVRSLTEIAIAQGKSTAIITTELLTGATPAAFSAHAASRNDTEDIEADQAALKKEYGTLILGNYGSKYTESTIKNKVEDDLQSTLKELSKNESGFFLMYEEAYFDKHSHSNDLEKTFRAGVRFNQVIGLCMEYAFYHPETVVVMTADHETGGLVRGKDGQFSYTTGSHTEADVPVFAYGHGMEVFHGITVENIQIPKTLAATWGVELTGYDNEHYPALGVK